MAASERHSYLKCKCQLRNKHEYCLSIEKVNRKIRYDMIRYDK